MSVDVELDPTAFERWCATIAESVTARAPALQYARTTVRPRVGARRRGLFRNGARMVRLQRVADGNVRITGMGTRLTQGLVGRTQHIDTFLPGSLAVTVPMNDDSAELMVRAIERGYRDAMRISPLYGLFSITASPRRVASGEPRRGAKL